MNTEKQNVVVVGGGVIGLACAYYLSKAGRQVTVIERDSSLLSGSSGGNAGMVVPSHFIPLAAPGVISQGLKWMLDPKGPFFLRPRLDIDLIRWLWQFYRHANAGHVKRTELLLRDIGLESRRLHQELANIEGFTLVQRGLLMLCQSEPGLEDEAAVAIEAQRLGLKVEVFGKDRLKEFEPDTAIEALGGVWFAQDCHLDPLEFVAALRKSIIAHGGIFANEEVTGFIHEGSQVIGVKSAQGNEHVADQIILAGGIVSSELARKLGLKLPMQGGKGYSLTLKKPRKSLQLCSLLKEGRVAVTPMGDSLRVAGTMEICGTDTSLSPARLQGIIETFCRFYPEFEPDDFAGIEPWIGLRPCSPDGLPYFGFLSKHPRVLVGTGHSMMGLSLAPVTGMLAEMLISGEASPIGLTQMSPERFH